MNLDYDESTRIFKSTFEQISNDRLGNYNYFRYWHGYVLLIRLAHLFMDVQGLYLMNFILIAFLLFILICSLYYKGYKYEAFALLASYIAMRFYNINISLEYAWIFILNLVLCIVLVHSRIRDWDKLNKFLFISGMLTCYFDFLTCEIVNLYIPLLLFLSLTGYRGLSIKNIAKSTVIWGVAYSFTYIAKWCLIIALFGFDYAKTLFGRIGTRTLGGVDWTKDNMPYMKRIFMSLSFNIRFLGVAIVLALIILVICYYVRFRNIDSTSRLLLLIALAPYARYLILLNHSIWHYFFTYRSQVITVFAVLLSIKGFMRIGDLRLIRSHKI